MNWKEGTSSVTSWQEESWWRCVKPPDPRHLPRLNRGRGRLNENDRRRRRRSQSKGSRRQENRQQGDYFCLSLAISSIQRNVRENKSIDAGNSRCEWKRSTKRITTRAREDVCYKILSASNKSKKPFYCNFISSVLSNPSLFVSSFANYLGNGNQHRNSMNPLLRRKVPMPPTLQRFIITLTQFKVHMFKMVWIDLRILILKGAYFTHTLKGSKLSN